MLRNYFKVAIRHLKKNRVYTVINLSGLSVGIMCCLLIFLYVSHELSYDRDFDKSSQIYRILRTFQTEGSASSTPATAGPYGPTLVMEYPDDILQQVRIFPDNGLISIGDSHIQEESICYVDSNFFKLFTFPVISGSPTQALSQPNYAMLSRQAATKYFGDEDPVGKTFEVDGRYQFIVNGVYDRAFNSTLGFDVLLPIAIFEDRSWFNNWRSNGFYTYLEINRNSDIAQMEEKFVGFMDERFGDEFEKQQTRQDLVLQPLSDIYLNTAPEYDFVPHGNGTMVYASIGIALFILFIACINFINLSTAKYSSRLGEIGIRKVLGAYRSNLRVQYLVESVILATLSLAVGVALLEAALPFFNDFAGLQLHMVYLDPAMIGVVLILIVLVGVLAGLYPAVFLSSFKPISILRTGASGKSGTARLRKVLVVVQFGISIVLIVTTSMMLRQLQFMQDKDLGFDKDQVAIIDVNNRELFEHWDSFRANLLNRADVMAMTMASGEPGGFHDQFIREIDEQDHRPVPLRTVFADHDYLKTYGLELVAGRDFDRKLATDTAAVILNQSALKKIGWEAQEAIGKEITEPAIPGWSMTTITKRVIGVVKDYHMASMRESIEPLIIAIGGIQNRSVGIKFRGGEIRNSLAAVEEEWSRVVTRHPLPLTFLDARLNALYQAEYKQSRLFFTFAALAIFIGCLGLYGLVSYAAEQRRREIGIRKVHGASISNIILLLSRDFSQLVLVAFVLAIPLGYYFMDLWLNDFAYRISIGWDLFVLAGVIALVISWVTVSYESYKAANTNPVDSLRHE